MYHGGMEKHTKARGCFRSGVPRPWRYKGGRKAAQDRYRQKNSEKIRAQKRLAYQNNKEASRVRSARWRKNNPQLWLEMSRRSNRKQRESMRAAMLAAYGSRCSCCGEREPLFLDLDHINNDGAKDRKQNGSGVKLLRRLEKAGWPKDAYQILCSNCNQGKQRNGGVCPHKSKKNPF